MYCHIKAYSSIFFTGDLTSHCRAIVIVEFSSFFFFNWRSHFIKRQEQYNWTHNDATKQQTRQLLAVEKCVHRRAFILFLMDAHARNVVHHGPIDPSVLYLQSEHCSTSIWDMQVCHLQSYWTYNTNTWIILTALCTVGPSSIAVSTEQGHSSLLTCIHIGSFTAMFTYYRILWCTLDRVCTAQLAPHYCLNQKMSHWDRYFPPPNRTVYHHLTKCGIIVLPTYRWRVSY